MDTGIIDAHMHPYLAEDRNFPFAIPENYEKFFSEQRRTGQSAAGKIEI